MDISAQRAQYIQKYDNFRAKYQEVKNTPLSPTLSDVFSEVQRECTAHLRDFKALITSDATSAADREMLFDHLNTICARFDTLYTNFCAFKEEESAKLAAELSSYAAVRDYTKPATATLRPSDSATTYVPQSADSDPLGVDNPLSSSVDAAEFTNAICTRGGGSKIKTIYPPGVTGGTQAGYRLDFEGNKSSGDYLHFAVQVNGNHGKKKTQIAAIRILSTSSLLTTNQSELEKQIASILSTISRISKGSPSKIYTFSC